MFPPSAAASADQANAYGARPPEAVAASVTHSPGHTDGAAGVMATDRPDVLASEPPANVPPASLWMARGEGVGKAVGAAELQPTTTIPSAPIAAAARFRPSLSDIAPS